MAIFAFKSAVNFFQLILAYLECKLSLQLPTGYKINTLWIIKNVVEAHKSKINIFD
jgi:hypothetical protein